MAHLGSEVQSSSTTKPDTSRVTIASRLAAMATAICMLSSKSEPARVSASIRACLSTARIQPSFSAYSELLLDLIRRSILRPVVSLCQSHQLQCLTCGLKGLDIPHCVATIIAIGPKMPVAVKTFTCFVIANVAGREANAMHIT